MASVVRYCCRLVARAAQVAFVSCIAIKLLCGASKQFFGSKKQVRAEPSCWCAKKLHRCYRSANTNAAGQIIDWFILGNVYLPGNIQEQAYSINSLAGTPPGVNPGNFDYDQATICVVSSICTYSWIFNPSGSLPGDWTLTVSAETPLPAALPLFATGLAGLGLLGWRRKRKAVA